MGLSGGLVVEGQTPNQEVLSLFPTGLTVLRFEQDTLTPSTG